MKLITLFLFLIIIFGIIELLIFSIEKILFTGRKIIQTIKFTLFCFFIIGVLVAPEELGKTLRPILIHFGPIIEWILNSIWQLFSHLLQETTP